MSPLVRQEDTPASLSITVPDAPPSPSNEKSLLRVSSPDVAFDIRACELLSVCGLSYYFLLGSIPNGADPMVEVMSLFLLVPS